MSSREQNIELVRAAFEAFERGDVEAINELLDPAVEVHISDSLMNAGTWSGIDGFWESVAGWLEAWDDYRLEVRSVEAIDERAVLAEGYQSGTGRASGVPVEMVAYWLFVISDGRCARYELHATREGALSALGSSPR